MRVGYVDGEYVLYPTYDQLERSSLDLVVTSTRDKVIMVEAGAKAVPEDIFVERRRAWPTSPTRSSSPSRTR